MQYRIFYDSLTGKYYPWYRENDEKGWRYFCRSDERVAFEHEKDAQEYIENEKEVDEYLRNMEGT